MDTLYVVIPCYNETEVLRETTRHLVDKMNRMRSSGIISDDSRIVYVDDGSSDGTWELIEQLHSENPTVEGVKLSRNTGHQNALLAGLMTARDKCDCAITMDADLQDDVEVMDAFIHKFDDGSDIVYGVRSSRDKDTFFKRVTAEGFYKLLNSLGAETVLNHSEYRLMSARVLDELSKFGEVNLYLRGIVTRIGYRTDTVEYARGERFAGETKYPLRKLLAFAEDGITSFSAKPISILAAIGVTILLASLVAAIWGVFAAFTGYRFAAVAWAIISVWGSAGLISTGLGVVGTYVWKTYMETKHRPRYIIEKILGENRRQQAEDCVCQRK